MNDTTAMGEGAASQDPRHPWYCPTNLAIGLNLGSFFFGVPEVFGSAPSSMPMVRQCVWYQQRW